MLVPTIAATVFLRELHVEHLRAIRSASMRLDESVTVIGENDSGGSSLLRALELALGPDGTPPLHDTDFHRDRGAVAPSGIPRVTLVFEERAAGEWSGATHAALHSHLPPATAGLRRLLLQATGVRGVGGEPPSLRFDIHGVHDEGARQALVEHVRVTTPLIRIAGGTLTGHADNAARGRMANLRPTGRAAPEAGLVERILLAADDLLSGTAVHAESRLDAGAEAARELLAQRPQHVDPGGSGFASSIREILGMPVQTSPRRARPSVRAPITVADRLGTLLLLAAVLRRMPGGLPPGVEPLWVIEDPEAHLHPMTLAATERLLQRIRWQKIVTTQSGDLLSTTPLAQVRRLVRHDGVIRVAALRPRALSREHLRRIGYHLRMHRGVAMFARVWLLVEGESEFWILPQVAQVMGYDLPLEGICAVGFAQCGIDPLVRTAREFGIEWHLLADGDEAGRRYVDTARGYIRRGEEHDRVTFLPERDIEHCFWHSGHAETIVDVAGLAPSMARRLKPTPTIARAVQRRSKPHLALRLVESVAVRGSAGVPAPLARLIETCVRLAREAPQRAVVSRTAGS